MSGDYDVETVVIQSTFQASNGIIENLPFEKYFNDPSAAWWDSLLEPKVMKGYSRQHNIGIIFGLTYFRGPLYLTMPSSAAKL